MEEKQILLIATKITVEMEELIDAAMEHPEEFVGRSEVADLRSKLNPYSAPERVKIAKLVISALKNQGYETEFLERADY